jgi:hypothetical protein
MPIFLLSDQMCRIFTTLVPTTLRRLASEGRLPVAAWYEGEPLFARDPKTIREILRAINEYSC